MLSESDDPYLEFITDDLVKQADIGISHLGHEDVLFKHGLLGSELCQSSSLLNFQALNAGRGETVNA